MGRASYLDRHSGMCASQSASHSTETNLALLIIDSQRCLEHCMCKAVVCLLLPGLGF